jgi:hypothetical protein
MAEAYMLAIDLAKHSFQVCATDRAGSCVDAPRIARGLAQRFIGRVSGRTQSPDGQPGFTH